MKLEKITRLTEEQHKFIDQNFQFLIDMGCTKTVKVIESELLNTKWEECIFSRNRLEISLMFGSLLYGDAIELFIYNPPVQPMFLYSGYLTKFENFKDYAKRDNESLEEARTRIVNKFKYDVTEGGLKEVIAGTGSVDIAITRDSDGLDY